MDATSWRRCGVLKAALTLQLRPLLQRAARVVMRLEKHRLGASPAIGNVLRTLPTTNATIRRFWRDRRPAGAADDAFQAALVRGRSVAVLDTCCCCSHEACDAQPQRACQPLCVGLLLLTVLRRCRKQNQNEKRRETQRLETCPGLAPAAPHHPRPREKAAQTRWKPGAPHSARRKMTRF